MVLEPSDNAYRHIFDSRGSHISSVAFRNVLQGYSLSGPDSCVATPKRVKTKPQMDVLPTLVDFDSRFTIFERLDAVPSNRLHTHVLAKSSTEANLLLSFAPRNARRLRVESSSVRAEATLLQWLSDVAYSDTDSTAPQSHKQQRSSVDQSEPSGLGIHTHRSTLQDYLPEFIKLYVGQSSHDEVLVRRPINGILLSMLPGPLSDTCRKGIDFQIGLLLRRISLQRSPTGRFGLTSTVLASPRHADPTLLSRTKASAVNSTYETWSAAFLSLLESILRDAEDVAISVPYEKIRYHATRFRRVLDDVTRPALVIVDAGENFNTLVGSSLKGSPLASQLDTQSSNRSPSPKHEGDTPEALTPRPPLQPGETQAQGPFVGEAVPEENETKGRETSLQVVGMRDLHNSIFGDPLFASVLSSREGAHIWEGFTSYDTAADSDRLSHQSYDLGHQSTTGARRLLYECYHALCAIVTEYYRRRSDSDEREMPARKRLVQVLAKLDGLDDLGKGIHERPEAESSPAKRLRQN